MPDPCGRTTIAIAGLRRYGEDAAALRIFDGLVDAASGFRDGRLPELFSGYPRREEDRSPIHYPAACSPQAWSAGALPLALTEMLGLRPDALSPRHELRRPRLPSRLQHVEIRDLRVGAARIDLSLGRPGEEGHASVEWCVRVGHLDVEVTEELAPPDRTALETNSGDYEASRCFPEPVGNRARD